MDPWQYSTAASILKDHKKDRHSRALEDKEFYKNPLIIDQSSTRWVASDPISFLHAVSLKADGFGLGWSSGPRLCFMEEFHFFTN